MRQPKKSGFTLVELMIAMVAGGFAVASIYYLNGVSSRSFAEQMRVSETQMSVRSAMEQLRRDFSRAGYLGTPSSKLVPLCDGTFSTGTGATEVAPRLIQAVRVTRDGSLADTTVSGLLNAVTNKTRADTVDVWGNYATPEVYLANPGTSSTSITFQTSSEAFRRSFYQPVANNGAATVFDTTRFADVFKVGRMVRIENGGHYFFRDITSVTTSPPTVVFAALPDVCFKQNDWTAIAPLMHLQYALEPDSTADLGRLQSQQTALGATGSAPPGTRRTVLVRREWRDDTGAVVAGTSRLVLDYAVEFGVDAWVNTDLTVPPATPARPAYALQRGATLTATTAASAASTPHRLRSLLVTLTARSPEVDPKLPVLARSTFDDPTNLDSPLWMFGVDPSSTPKLNARTRTLRSEIFLLNL
ncbi:MAG: hypothetical protein JWN48_140 [Myxococcaceae bacterium]|nr:hypothetical protein [Myxococcaceae bacterium]